MSETNNVASKEQMASLDPSLVHRVLLTDPSQFSTLTVSGKGHNDKMPTFEDFCKELDSSSSHSMEVTMKRAYRDRIADLVFTSHDMKPLHELLLELHRAVRSLVPNRPDLHSILKDDDVEKVKNPNELLPHVVVVGNALSLLESQLCSETTQEWLERAQSDNTRGLEAKRSIEFLVTSIIYLLFKAETCQQEKQDFFLGFVLAPRIHSQGVDLERHAFQAKYGQFDESSTAPYTRQWINELVSQNNPTEIGSSVSAREEMVKQGWIRNILFRQPEQASIPMPEILDRDVEQLNNIGL